MRWDTHVHSTFSPDGADAPEAFARQVDAGVADGIGFAEHYDFLPECGAFGYLNEELYLNTMAQWRSKGYRFFAGVEVDFISSEKEAIRAALRKYPFDFVIASIHTLPSGGVSDRNIDHFYDDNVFDSMLREYASEFLESLRMPEVDVVGHPGVFQRYLDAAFFVGKPWEKRIRELEEALAVAASRTDKLVEVNCSGFFATSENSCATPHFLKHYQANGGNTLSIGSDSHRAEHLFRGIPRGVAMLQAMGFRHCWLPWDRTEPVLLETVR